MESPSNLQRYGVVSLSTAAGSVVWIVGATVFFRSDAKETSLLMVTALVAFLSAMIGVSWLLRDLRPDETVLEDFKRELEKDSLTDLPNQRTLHTELENSIKAAKRAKSTLGVLFIDVDRFKNINDSMGHDAGDELLQRISQRIAGSVRSTDVVARFGGDEFVVLCPDLLNESSVVDLAKQLLRSFDETFPVRETSQKVSASIGITTFDEDDSRTGPELLRDADLAMFTAKRAKTRYALFTEQHRVEVLARQEIEQDLVQAVKEREFNVVYQPLVNLDTGLLYGFEALVRWNHPTKGQIMPGDFLSVAEECGLIGEIGSFVMREACAQAAVWNHLNPQAESIRMGVNLAEQQLLDRDLPSRVTDLLKWAGLKPEQLVLEITEDVMVEHLGGLDTLRELGDLGVGLAIDDFGTGQSSLSYLKQFDMVSTLKVDQSFVRGLESGNADSAIVQAVVSMSDALQLKVVVEGVETHEQCRILQEMGVHVMQGYLFSAPVNPPDGDPAAWFETTLIGSGQGRSRSLRAIDVSSNLLADRWV